jgi:hypothetical protein
LQVEGSMKQAECGCHRLANLPFSQAPDPQSQAPDPQSPAPDP